MPRKVLITFLGTGRLNKEGTNTRDYAKVTYLFNGKKIESSFVSLILAGELKADKVIIIGTLKSMWEELYLRILGEGNINEDFYLELTELHKTYKDINDDVYRIISRLEKEVSEKAGLNIKILLLKNGINQDEIDFNIDVTIDFLQNQLLGDIKWEVYVDITHGFRSMAFIINQVIFYFSQVFDDQIKFRKIYYGMMEVIKDLGYAPIVSLSRLIDLNQWAQASYAFKNYGNAYLLSDLLTNKKDNPAIKVLKEFSNTLNLSLIFHVKNQLKALDKLIKQEYHSSLASLIIPRVIQDFSSFFGSSSQLLKDSVFQIKLARWHFNRKNFGLSVIVLYEAAITWICENENLEPTARNDRERAKSLLSDKNYHDLRNILNKYKIDNIRNGVAHQLPKQIPVSTAIKNLESALNELEKIILV